MMLSVDLILGNLILASAIGALALAVGRRGRRAPLAHALWIMFFVKLVTPPILAVPLPMPAFTQHADSLQGTQTLLAAGSATNKSLAVDNERTTQPAVTASSTLASAAEPRASLLTYATPQTGLIALWIGGFAFLFFRGVTRLYRFRKLIEACGIDDLEATRVVEELVNADKRYRFFHNRAPRVVRVSIRVSPMLFGFAMRPLILCPEELWGSLSTDDRRAFLAHETAHFLRRDHWVRPLEWLVTSLFWWFPGVYFGRQQLERHEEACCDARAVAMLKSKPREYAEALLRVVDFISEHGVTSTRMASPMQPTATLEERLRLLMRDELSIAPSRLHSWGCGLICASIWIIHPDIYQIEFPSQSIAVTASASQAAAGPDPVPEPSVAAERRLIQPITESDLPAVPKGFWNTGAAKDWASFSFDVSGYRLDAIAGQGILVHRDDGKTLRFNQQTMTAIAEVPRSKRVIIGDADGNVRLWDLEAGTPVSLLGRHNAAITSVAISSHAEVFSADAGGTIFRWKMQSGEILSQWSVDDGPHQSSSRKIASLRVAADGQSVAVLCSDWRDKTNLKEIHLLDSKTLKPLSSVFATPQAAVAFQFEEGAWVVVDWDGVIRLMNTAEPIGSIEKQRVSALLLSQNAPLLNSDH